MPRQRKNSRRLFRTEASPRKLGQKQPHLEELETRTLMSTTLLSTNLHTLVAAPGATLAQVIPGATITPAGLTNAPNVAPFTPGAIRTAYGVTKINFPNGAGGYVTGTGAGETIAIVDAQLDPDIAADLVTFDRLFNLPAPASFTVLNQNGGTDLSAIPLASSAIETSLDVEWAHTIAPGANIVLFEANSLSFLDLGAAFLSAANPATYTALGLPAAGVISNSYGANETPVGPDSIAASSEAYLDANYYEPVSAAGNVTAVFSSGDDAAQNYPSTSPYVLSVGGTTLTATTTQVGVAYKSETAWSEARDRSEPTGEEGSGGGTALYEPEPTYQISAGIHTTNRATPDVSWDANPSSGVWITDTLDFPSDSAIGSIGGTSLAAPLWSGLLADANQGRALASEAPLANAQEAVYSLPKADFHDITSGHNIPATAGPGYDEVTGIGSPIANLVAEGLVSSTTGPVTFPAGVTPLFAGGVVSVSTDALIDTAHGGQQGDSQIVAAESQIAGSSVATILAPASQQALAFRTDTTAPVAPAVQTVNQVVHAGVPTGTSLSDQSAVITDDVQLSGAGTGSDVAADVAVPFGAQVTPMAGSTTDNVAPVVPAAVAGTVSDAVFADFGSVPAAAIQLSAPAGVVGGDETHTVDLAVFAGLALAVGGMPGAFVSQEDTRKTPALRDK